MNLAPIQNMIRRAIAPLAQRVRMMVSRGVVKRVNESTKCQELQLSLMADEVQDTVEHFQEYGFTSHSFVDAEALFFSVGGCRSHGIAGCVTDRRYRPKNMAEGDVCLYTDKGERVYLERAGDIVNLGEKSADDFVALAQKVLDELNLIKTDLTNVKSTFDAHVHILTINAAVGAGGTGTAAAPAGKITAPHDPASVACSKVKAS